MHSPRIDTQYIHVLLWIPKPFQPCRHVYVCVRSCEWVPPHILYTTLDFYIDPRTGTRPVHTVTDVLAGKHILHTLLPQEYVYPCLKQPTQYINCSYCRWTESVDYIFSNVNISCEHTHTRAVSWPWLSTAHPLGRTGDIPIPTNTVQQAISQ